MIQGIIESDPMIHHAARLGENTNEYWALCDAGRVVVIPGSFEPKDPNACRACVQLVQGG